MKQNDIAELPVLESSRLEKLFNVYQTDNGEYYYNILNTINFDTANIAAYMYQVYSVLQGDSYAFISYKKYDTINLWWLICAFNGIQNPTKMPEPGTYLRILDPAYVTNILTQLDRA